MKEQINVKIFNTDTGKYIDHQVYKYIPKNKTNSIPHNATRKDDGHNLNQNKKKARKSNIAIKKDIINTSNYFSILNSKAASVAHVDSLTLNLQKETPLLPLHSTVNDPFDNEKPHITASGHLGSGETFCPEAAPSSSNKVAQTHPQIDVVNIVITSSIIQNRTFLRSTPN